jgi:DNA-binding NarL/FixJ family response regulator
MESYISHNRSPQQFPVDGNLKVQMTNRVLIVDDSRQMRELIKMTLAGVAEVVGECADGAGALDCYEANSPDWVLMDWEMRTDGLTATRRILKAHPEARILIVTSHDDEELRTAAIEAGARGVVLKDDLLALGSYLEKR